MKHKKTKDLVNVSLTKDEVKLLLLQLDLAIFDMVGGYRKIQVTPEGERLVKGQIDLLLGVSNKLNNTYKQNEKQKTKNN